MNAKIIWSILGASALALAVGAAGCGEDGGLADGGELYLLESGTYVASAATNVVDGCNQNPNDPNNPLAGFEFPLTNDSGEVSLGPPAGTPPEPSQGKGFVDQNTGTLTRNNQVSTSEGGCTYTRSVTNEITLTADNTFTSNYTRVDSDHSAGCTQQEDCTTSFTFTLTKKQ